VEVLTEKSGRKGGDLTKKRKGSNWKEVIRTKVEKIDLSRKPLTLMTKECLPYGGKEITKEHY